MKWTIIKPSRFIFLCQRKSAGSILETLLLHVKTNFIILFYHIKDALVSLYTHLLSFHRMDKSHWASGGGFTNILLFNESPCKKAVLISILWRSYFLWHIIDRTALKVSLEHVGESFCISDKLSSSNPCATSLALGFIPSLVFFNVHTHLRDMHFWFELDFCTSL